MKYSSIREYFYKLNNPLYFFMLIPLLMLVILYWQLQQGNISAPFYGNVDIKKALWVSLCIMVCSGWLISFFLFSRGLKTLKKIPSLGVRLDRYYSLTLVRYVLIPSCSIILAIGFYLTEDQFFTVAAILNLILALILWPVPSKVCRDLQLKGDERTLVFHMKDRLH